jgi:hypothetical protein
MQAKVTQIKKTPQTLNRKAVGESQLCSDKNVVNV